MEKFINKIARIIHDKGEKHIENITVVFPNKRAGVFFKKALSDYSEKPLWAPNIYSIEQWIEELSGLEILDKSTLLFELYSVYKKTFPKEQQDSFDSFLGWAPNLLSDFNEIDAYLKSPERLFDYLHQTKKIEAWSPEYGPTSENVKKYLNFWKLLGLVFEVFKTNLLKKKSAFQGMAYRKAVNSVYSWIKKNKPVKKSIYYAGFNAMNPCEEKIMRIFIAEDLMDVFWDTDSYYIEDSLQEAGRHLRMYRDWPEFKGDNFNWVNNNLKKQKKISVYGVSKNIAQAQLAGELINEHKSINKNFKDVALVLSDETLLLPVVEFLSSSLNKINITIGAPIKNFHMFAFFDAFFLLHINKEYIVEKDQKFYYKDLLKILNHVVLQSPKNNSALIKINHKIKKRKLFFPTKNELLTICDEPLKPWLTYLLNYDGKKNINFINDALSLINLIKNKKNNKEESLEVEQIFVLTEIFNKIKNLQKKYNFIRGLKILHRLFILFSKVEKLSFYGDPFSGLQIMGMLETRNLDFNHVIILSMNEGIVPGVKNENSFIPFDIRKELGLPTFSDKDSIFAYHFYRLIQRSKSVSLIYNTEPDLMGSGEKSRFITQLENELVTKYPSKIRFSETILSHKLNPINQFSFKIKKNDEILSILKEIATSSGFSPSSLNIYKNCPLEFYYEKILKIKKPEKVKEIIEVNILGSLVHKALEQLFLPYLNKSLKPIYLKKMISLTPSILKDLFIKESTEDELKKGKNILIYNVALQFILSYLKQEQRNFLRDNNIVVQFLEKKFKEKISLPGINFPVYLRGEIDRIELRNGKTRIIDFKTGKVESKELLLNNLNEFILEKKHYKGFQLYFYALLFYKAFPERKPIEAGIISFRGLKKGFIPASHYYFGLKNSILNKNILTKFEKELKVLLLEIFNPDVCFEHNNRKEPCRFCDPEAFY